MNAKHDRNGLIVLDREACLARLARRRLATLALSDGALPVAVPAVYALADEMVYLAGSKGGLVGRCLPGSIVSMCVHDVDDDLAGGWSVTVTGLATPLKLTNSSLALLGLVPSPWLADEGTRILVSLDTQRTTGREIARS
jgi:nitroimidazol reductase NimA-like FMN-containing flavoprotein (pyridoxamine 5'-phosphate oxidase superfamily)